MNKQYSPIKPYRSSFHEEWLFGVLVIVAFFQIGFSLHESSAIARPGHTLSMLPIRGEELAKQPRPVTPLPAKPAPAFLSLAVRA